MIKKKACKPNSKANFFPSPSKSISKPKSPDVKRIQFELEFDIAKVEGVYSPKIDYLFFDFPEGKSLSFNVILGTTNELDDGLTTQKPLQFIANSMNLKLI